MMRRICAKSGGGVGVTNYFETGPNRIPLNGSGRNADSQIYHFLVGDPGMSDYTDKVIRQLEPDKMKQIAAWRKEFTKPYREDEIVNMLKLSDLADDLWQRQLAEREALAEKTAEPLSIYGHEEEGPGSRLSIRQKDALLTQAYKTQEAKNAGPYARLKLAMDYWCALWSWPIEKADLLPSRAEFILDMYNILEGSVDTADLTNRQGPGQQSFFNPLQEQAEKTKAVLAGHGIVNIPWLREHFERIDLVCELAEKNKYLHWELEFADVFAQRGGFDLILGNPPWIKLEWQEQDVLSETDPSFAIKKLSAKKAADLRPNVLQDATARQTYLAEYEALTGQKDYLGATANYPSLHKVQTNLFKCFLPQAWMFTNKGGVSAFLHPEGVYDDPGGGPLREEIYKRLVYHFGFVNERNLFEEVHHATTFGLNVYSNREHSGFDTIANLYATSTLDECYDKAIEGTIPGTKDAKGNWALQGHPGRVMHVDEEELRLFAQMLDQGGDWKQARMPALHAQALMDALEKFAQPQILGNLGEDFYVSLGWHETNSQKDGTIARDVHFPTFASDCIYSGPHLHVANPLFKCSRTVCRVNSDYDPIDLTSIPESYRPRINYAPALESGAYEARIPLTPWGQKITDCYRIANRRMVGCSAERSLMPAIFPLGVTHIDTVAETCLRDIHLLTKLAGYEASIPFDFYVRVIGKRHIDSSTIETFPIITSEFDDAVALRALLLNCLTESYTALWEEVWKDNFMTDTWAKTDLRLAPEQFSSLTGKWTRRTPLRTDYARRQALVELDVLTAMALGITLEELKTVYRLQFAVMQKYEKDTWYDANGRIAFTTNKGLSGVGFSREEWCYDVKGPDAPAGRVFSRTVMDDTQPGGPIERTIEYLAPFDTCDRMQDYETAWKHFEEKYASQK